MKVIFATTNNRKLQDLNDVIKDNNLDLEVVSLSDIGWDRGEIEEDGTTIAENSLIKANAVFDFCQENAVTYPIITDDAGLFVKALNGEPGVYTARYADEELSKDETLPKHFCLIKMINKLKEEKNRDAEYKCVVTVMFANGKYEQFTATTKGLIDKKINEPIKKPYFYSLFVEKETNMPFNQLTKDQLKNTYRFKALTESLVYLNNNCKENTSTSEQ